MGAYEISHQTEDKRAHDLCENSIRTPPSPPTTALSPTRCSHSPLRTRHATHIRRTDDKHTLNSKSRETPKLATFRGKVCASRNTYELRVGRENAPAVIAVPENPVERTVSPVYARSLSAIPQEANWILQIVRWIISSNTFHRFVCLLVKRRG